MFSINEEAISHTLMDVTWGIAQDFLFWVYWGWVGSWVMYYVMSSFSIHLRVCQYSEYCTQVTVILALINMHMYCTVGVESTVLYVHVHVCLSRCTVVYCETSLKVTPESFKTVI